MTTPGYALISQVVRAELESKASKSAGESAEQAKAAQEEAAKAQGKPMADDVRIDENSFLINLIDSPGHVDFSSEVRITALRKIVDQRASASLVCDV